MKTTRIKLSVWVVKAIGLFFSYITPKDLIMDLRHKANNK